MRRIAFALVVAAHAGAPSSTASADSGIWSDREICRAAVKTYFFLPTKPANAVDSGEHFGFRSTAGNVYTCRVAGQRAEFRWVDASGRRMKSASTTFRVSAGTLIVQTETTIETFGKE
ncbi:MAG: hypothetical protein OXI73_12030 [Rhodospirillales bacterium]|nr:hypothetical protein [Rhodospirillales bacterium]